MKAGRIAYRNFWWENLFESYRLEDKKMGGG
jgi:hypothetical protein